MNQAVLSRLSEQDYLHDEMNGESRHEYVDGVAFAMAGAGEAHNLISLNIASKLREFVRGSPCRVYISDMKLHVETWKAYYYPDIMVVCDPADNHDYFKEHPSVVLEVLSPATERTDRREKMLAYRTLPSLREYLLVAADRRKVERYCRDEQEEWKLVESVEPDVVQLQSIGATLSLDEIYEEVKLDNSRVRLWSDGIY